MSAESLLNKHYMHFDMVVLAIFLCLLVTVETNVLYGCTVNCEKLWLVTPHLTVWFLSYPNVGGVK